MNELQIFQSPEFGRVRTVSLGSLARILRWLSGTAIQKMRSLDMSMQRIKGGRESRPPQASKT